MKKKVKVELRELKGNMGVKVSENEVRIWVCNDEGQSIFRFKAIGKVYEGEQDVIVIGGK